MNLPKHHILYHDHCADGFLSYVIARFALESVGIHPSNIHGHPCSYNAPITSLHPYDVEPGDSVLMLDFSAPVELMDAFAEAAGAANFRVLDHHASVPEEARARPYFDYQPNRAGCFMTYWRLAQGVFRAGPASVIGGPSVIDLIEWRDLGNAWKYPKDPRSDTSHALHAGLMRLLPRRYKAWLEIVLYEVKAEALIRAGSELRTRDSLITRAAAASPTWIRIHDHVIPAIDGIASVLISDGCQMLLDQYPKAPFAAAWFIDPVQNHFVVSLRSRADGPDVSVIATTFGGGGHRNAAGSTSSYPLPITSKPE